MIANNAVKILKLWNFESGYRLGDGVDVISSTFTNMLTMCLAAIMAVKTYILSPIECYAPIPFRGSNFENYVNNFCFVEGSVALSEYTVKHNFPQTQSAWENAKKAGHVGYYPWIPLYLSVMGLIPFLINMMWKLIYTRRIGTDLQGLLEMAHKAQLLDGEERRKLIERISAVIAETLWKNREYRTGRCARIKNRCFEIMGFGFFSKRFGSWLNFWYFIVKLAYLASHLLALFLMHKFLNINDKYYFFGFQVFHNIMSGKFWDDTLIFPRVTWCNVPIKHNRVNVNVVQCVLPGNLFSEIIFALLWIWHAIVMVLMFFSVVRYMNDTFNTTDHNKFIRKCLTLSGEIQYPDRSVKNEIYLFGKNFLRQDGTFTLRMFESAIGTAVTCDIATTLWKMHKGSHRPLPAAIENKTAVIEMDPIDNVAHASKEKDPFADDDSDSKSSNSYGFCAEPKRNRNL